MRILLLADGWVGWEVTRYLRGLGEDIVGLMVHPPAKQHYTQEIIQASGLASTRIWQSGKTIPDEVLSEVGALQPDIVFSIFWNYILPPGFFRIPPDGCINFHCSYLPFNRGKNPNVWPIVEGTPAGVTLHYIDEGIDSGSIVAQREVVVDIVDTAKTLYNKLLLAFVDLFKEAWLDIKAGRISAVQQNSDQGTFHWSKDFRKLDEIDLNRKYDPMELINLLRARTFSPHPAAYFLHEGRKINVRIELEYAEEE